MNGVDTLFVVSTLHEVVRKNSAAAMETREKGDNVDVLFVVSTLREVTRKDSVETREKGDSTGVLFTRSPERIQ